jgi:CheY-like chemotaxis protein
VEDEDDARQLLAEMLAQSGCRVTAVPSPLEALAVLRDHRFDLVVTDLLMPGGGGRLVLEWLQRTPGAPPALVVSGYDLSELHEQHFAPLRMKCLAKPFLRDALLTVIAELLGNPPPP